MVGVGGGLVALQSLLTIKRGTSPFNSQSNELFSKFLRQQMTISKFKLDTPGKYEACVWGGGYPPSDYYEY